MQSLKVTAHLSSPIAVYDDYSPAIDSLLEWLLLDRLNLISPNPTPEQVDSTREIIEAQLPLERGSINGEWYWQASSPCYIIQIEQADRYRKRWEPGQDGCIDWGKRKAKWNTSEGAEKSYDLPLYLRSTPIMTWYVVGDRAVILDLLQDCRGLGKKRSYGYGQITKWDVEPHEDDWHLWRDGQLMRSIPIAAMPTDRPTDFAILNWGWRPPAWLHSNKTRCAMPIHTVRKLTAVG